MKKQERLLGTKIIILLGAALIAIFILLFRQEDHLNAMINLVQPDRISAIYLQLLVNIDPKDSTLRLALAKQYIKIGYLDNAHSVLQPLLNQQGREQIEARLLILDLDLRDYFLKPAKDPAKASGLASLRKKIDTLSDKPIPVDLIPEVIQRSLVLDRPELAAKMYVFWATVDKKHQFEHLKAAGRWYVASGALMPAADIYNNAATAAANPEIAKQFQALAIDTLRAADKGALALTWAAAYLQRFPMDEKLLDQAITLSLAANDPKQALAWGKSRLALSPDNPDQLAKQIDIAMAAGALDEAWAVSGRLLKVLPKDPVLHEHMAQIAEWTGKPDLALPHWAFIVRLDNSKQTALENAVRLADGLSDGKTGLEMLTVLSKKRAFTATEFNYLTNAYNNLRRPADIVSFLQTYLQRYPDAQKAWEALAAAQENNNQLVGAIATWQYIDTHFKTHFSAILHQAKLFKQTGKTETAFKLLARNQQSVSAQEYEYWLLLADLSWSLKHQDTALTIYKALWTSGPNNELVPERLIQLLRDKAHGQTAKVTAYEAYQRYNKPRWLLLALDTAEQFGLWADVKQMLETAEKDKGQYQQLEMYWLISAQFHTHNHEQPLALADYQQALLINPASIVAKEGVLWTLIDGQDRKALANSLASWWQDAVTAPSLWAVYGLALNKLGEYEAALPWFARKAESDHADYLWVLAYADTLAKAGRADAALQLREYVLAKLKPQPQTDPDDPDKPKPWLAPEFLVLVREMQGADTEEKLLQKVSTTDVGKPALNELAISAYLAQKNFAAARFWMLRARSAHQQTPVWQRLALALADNDQNTIADILNKEGDKLSPTDHVEPLIRLNRRNEALAILDNYLQTSDDIGTSQSALYPYRNALAIQQSWQLDLAGEIKNLGALDIDQAQARFSMPFSKHSLALQFRHNQLESGDKNLALAAKQENELTIEGKYAFNSGTELQISMGGNQQSQESLIYGSLGLTKTWGNFLQANLRVGVHELSTETAALRALGAKDKLSLILAGKLSPQSFYQFDLDGHRYLTRQDSELGTGYKLSGIFGYTLMATMPTWQVRLQGSWEANSLNHRLPNELTTALLSPSANLETIVPHDYGTLGVGTSFRYGGSEQDAPRQPYLLLDGWLGWAWPANVLAYNGRAGLGVSLFRADVLSLSAFYGNVQGGQANTAYQGIGVQYSLKF